MAIGDMSQMLLASQRAVPEAALKSGFTFQFDTVEQALEREFPSKSSRRLA
jgi:NAD dependent epimerase/dehydratase family enzyme